MARKKAGSTKATIAFNRLLHDEQVQKQLRTGYSKVQEATSSFTSAGRRLTRRPQSPKLGGRALAIGAAAAAGVVALVLKRKSSSADEVEFTPVQQPTTAPSGAVAAPTPPTPVSAA